MFFQSATPSPNKTAYPFAGSGDQSLQCSERILPGFARIQATGSAPASMQVPTSNCSMTVGFVFFAIIVIARLQSRRFELFRSEVQRLGHGLPAVHAGLRL